MLIWLTLCEDWITRKSFFSCGLKSYHLPWLFRLKYIFKILLKFVYVFYISLIFNQICLAQAPKKLGQIDDFKLSCLGKQSIWALTAQRAILYREGILLERAKLMLATQPIYQSDQYWFGYQQPSIPFPIPSLSYQNQGFIVKLPIHIPIALKQQFVLKLGWWQNRDLSVFDRFLFELKWNQSLELLAHHQGMLLMGESQKKLTDEIWLSFSGLWRFADYPMSLSNRLVQQGQALFSSGFLALDLKGYTKIKLHQLDLQAYNQRLWIIDPTLTLPLFEKQNSFFEIKSTLALNIKQAFHASNDSIAQWSLPQTQNATQYLAVSQQFPSSQSAHFQISQSLTHRLGKQHFWMVLSPSFLATHAQLPIQIQGAIQTKLVKTLQNQIKHEVILMASYLYQQALFDHKAHLLGHFDQTVKPQTMPISAQDPEKNRFHLFLYSQSFQPFEQGYLSVLQRVYHQSTALSYQIYALTQKQIMLDMDLLFYGLLSTKSISFQRAHLLHQRLTLSYSSFLIELHWTNQLPTAFLASLKSSRLKHELQLYWQNQSLSQRNLHDPLLTQRYQPSLLFLNQQGIRIHQDFDWFSFQLSLAWQQAFGRISITQPQSILGTISIPLRCQCFRIELNLQHLRLPKLEDQPLKANGFQEKLPNSIQENFFYLMLNLKLITL